MIRKLVRSIFVLVLMSLSGCLIKDLSAETSRPIVTHVAFGTYQVAEGSTEVSGTQLSLGVYYPLDQKWDLLVDLADAQAKGNHKTQTGQGYQIKQSASTLSGGLRYNHPLGEGKKTVLFIGSGLSLQRYNYQFSYPQSRIGDTSGLGYGPFLLAGVRFHLSKSFLIIPGYQYARIYIKTQEGESLPITSQGSRLALIVRF